jgi:hypothetical protein
MWGDALLLDQPVQYRSRPAGGIGPSRSGFRQKRCEPRLGVCELRSQRVQAPGDFNRDAAWTRGVSEDRYCLDKISDCLSRFGISGIGSLGQSALKLEDEVTGDTRPGAIIEARSHDDLANTRDRPAFSRAFRGSVQAEIIDNREGKQRQHKPVECRLPFVLEKFVGVHFFALSPTFVIGEGGGAFLVQPRRNAIAPAMDRGRVRTARPSLPL